MIVDSNASLLAGIDIGAGYGSQIAIFDHFERCLCKGELKKEKYGDSADVFVKSLTNSLANLVEKNNLHFENIELLCVCLPGLVDHEGTLQKSSNLPFLKGVNLKNLLSKQTGISVVLLNDGDCGAFGEWSERQRELLYWTFGGGWGGSWIDQAGKFKFPFTSVFRTETEIHPTTEPGYTTELCLDRVAKEFNQFDANIEKFMELHQSYLVESPTSKCGYLRQIKAEVLISGPGCQKMFQSIVSEDQWNRYPVDTRNKLTLSETAGQMIYCLAKSGDIAAKKTFWLFGALLGIAATQIIKAVVACGGHSSIPVFLGGGIGRAYDLFIPKTRSILKKETGIDQVFKSRFLEKNQNANLIGAVRMIKKHHLKDRSASFDDV